MKTSIKAHVFAVFSLGYFFSVTGTQAQIVISAGYNDEPRSGGSFSGASYGIDSGQPLPWYGSSNTTFYGDAGTAQAYDPDEDALLFQNQGSSAVVLSAATIGGYDLFAVDSIGSPVTLAPGGNVILAGIDGSDVLSALTSVGLTINGTGYNIPDVATSIAPNGVLSGANPFIGGAESIPWTALDTVAAPEPSTYAMLLRGSGMLDFWRLRTRRA